MYEASDYHWNELTSPSQLVGIWYGSKIVAKAAVPNLCPAFDLLVRLKLVYVTASSNLFTIDEDQYYTDATSKGANWESLKSALAGTATGARINTAYPLLSDTDRTAFYGDAASTPGIRWEKEYWVQAAGMFPPFVSLLSVKVSDDGTKLLLQYSDDLQFVIGK